MSRIEEAFKRIARREVADAGSSKPSLERFTFEESPVGVHNAPVPGLARRSDPPRMPPPASAGDPVDSDEALVDFRQIWDYVGFVGRSVVRHPYVATLTFLLMIGATAGAVVAWPRTYHVEARLLAQQNSLMNSFGNPRAPSSSAGDSPTFAVSETILRRDNLVSLIKQTDLLNQWERTRPPAMRVKDRVMRTLGKEPNDKDRMDAMIGLLEQRFDINVTVEGTVLIAINWPDGRVGYELVETALQNFLDTRQAGEASALNDSITVLERYAATLENDVNSTFAEVQAEQAKRGTGVRRAATPIAAAAVTPGSPETVPGVSVLPSAPPEVMVRLGRMRAALDARRGEVARLEETKAQQISDAQNKLAAALTVYTEGHPMVASLRQSLTSAAQDSPQLQQARLEAQNLEREYVALAAAQEKPAAPPAATAAVDPKSAADGKSPAPTTVAKGAPTPRAGAAPGAATLDRSLDTATQALGSNDYSSLAAVRLRLQVAQLGDIRDRIAGARLALATSQAGFKYRYELTRPPQIPRAPIKPNVALVIAAGVIGALALAIAAALSRDLLSGRIVESWQLERQVGVAVLGRVRRL
jgi:hypothetical protein